MMNKCSSCNGTNLLLHTKKSLIELRENIWVNVTPLSPIENFYQLFCKDCSTHKRFNKKDLVITDNQKNKEKVSDFKIVTSSIPKKLVLDLDHTLICSFQMNDTDMDGDFSIDLGNRWNQYETLKRPHVDKFIQFCIDFFGKENITVVTAATKDYATIVCNNLGIDDVKLISREDLFIDRTLMCFDREHIKSIDNSLIIDDKPEVIRGINNMILSPKAFWGDSDDAELLKIIDFIKKASN